MHQALCPNGAYRKGEFPALPSYMKYKSMADKSSENVYIVGGLELNENTFQVSVDGKPVKLTHWNLKY